MKYWCSERESVQKLDAILKGHPDIFTALKHLQERGNQVTFAAGNHDVDVYWPEVQKKISEKAGPIRFATGQDVYTRYEGRLVIGHGHMIDPANKFCNWSNPFLVTPKGERRLEMCPGTLFMVKFVNWLERDYPFADNMKPLTTLARLLMKEDRGGLLAAASTILIFVGRHPVTALSINDEQIVDTVAINSRIVDELATNHNFRARVWELYCTVVTPSIRVDDVAQRLSTEDAVNNFLTELLVQMNPDRWLDVFDVLGPTTLGASDENTLSIIRSGMTKEKEDLKEDAKLRLAEPGVDVAIFGHTHQPDEWRGPDGTSEGGYFNPGSWTRYVDVSKMASLKLSDLKNEHDFPYQLNYIRVEQGTSGSLVAEKICYEKGSGERFTI